MPVSSRRSTALHRAVRDGRGGRDASRERGVRDRDHFIGARWERECVAPLRVRRGFVRPAVPVGGAHGAAPGGRRAGRVGSFHRTCGPCCHRSEDPGGTGRWAEGRARATRHNVRAKTAASVRMHPCDGSAAAAGSRGSSRPTPERPPRPLSSCRPRGWSGALARPSSGGRRPAARSGRPRYPQTSPDLRRRRWPSM